MKVKVTRRGGLAGIPLHGEVDTAALTAKQGRAAEAALGALTGLATGTPAGPPRHADGFQFELAFDGHTATIDETEVSAGLRPVIEAAMAHATLG